MKSKDGRIEKKKGALPEGIKKAVENNIQKAEEKIEKTLPNEIDDIFSSKKKQPLEKKQVKAVRPIEKDDDFNDSKGEKGGKRRYTEDGFPIYTLDELKIGRGGDTDDCPFDCNCCF